MGNQRGGKRMAEKIKIVCKSGSEDCVMKVSGQSVWLKVGSLDWLFFMHGNALTEYRTGFSIGSLNENCGVQMDKQIAQAMLNQLVKAYTAEMVQTHMAKRPTVNEEGGA